MNLLNTSRLVKTPNSPYKPNANTWQFCFTVVKGDAEDYIPDHNYYLSGYGYHDSTRARTAKGPGYYKLYLVFTKTPTRPRMDGAIYYDLDFNWVPKQLETHDNYRVKWNYNLYQRFANNIAVLSPSLPDWWSTATKQTDDLVIGKTEPAEYQWGKTRPASTTWNKVQYDYHKIANMTKPGVEVYEIPQPVVTATSYWDTRDKAYAQLSIASMGDVVTVPDAVGVTGGEWLYKPMNVRDDGTWYVTTEKYFFAVKWDGELYDGGTGGLDE